MTRPAATIGAASTVTGGVTTIGKVLTVEVAARAGSIEIEIMISALPRQTPTINTITIEVIETRITMKTIGEITTTNSTEEITDTANRGSITGAVVVVEGVIIIGMTIRTMGIMITGTESFVCMQKYTNLYYQIFVLWNNIIIYSGQNSKNFSANFSAIVKGS